MFLKILLIFATFTLVAHAADDIIPLLEINHTNSSKVVLYSAKIRDCKFKKVSEIRVEVFDRTNNAIMSPTFFESIYYEVQTLSSGDQVLEFQISAVKNFQFHFELQDCIPKRFVDYLGERYELEELHVAYHKYLGFPTLKELVAKVKNSAGKIEEIKIEYFNADGYIPFYEAHLGVGLNYRENIRPQNHLRDRNIFHRGKTVHEPMPLFLLRYGPFFLNKDGAGVVLLPLKNFALLFATIIDGEPYKADRLTERRSSFFSGWIVKVWDLTAFYFKDIQGFSHGEIMKLQLEHEFKLNRYWTLAPHVFVQWWDDEYMNYYFGVAPSEVNEVGKEYDARHTQNMEIMAKAYLKMGRYKWFVALGEKWYGKNVAASPLVRQDTEIRSIWGVTAHLF
jgi:outer membrane protein